MIEEKTMKRTILKNASILTLNSSDEILKNTDILIENDTIKKIEKNITPLSNEKVIDCSDLLITPGFVNAHLHSDEYMFKGLYDNMPLELWMLYSYPPLGDYGNLKDRLVYLRTQADAIEQIRSGITSCQDDVSGHPDTTADTHRIIFKAYEDIGMRANVSTSTLNKNFLDRIPYLRENMPKELKGKFLNPGSDEEKLKEAEKIIKEWDGVGNFKVSLSPIAPQRCDDKFNVKVYELAEKYDLPYHTHICETRMQRESGFDYYGKTIIGHCKDLGILSKRTTIAHGIWLDDEDIEIVAQTGANIAHNTVSNLKLGSGIMPYAKMLEKGVKICLGTDGSSSNDSQNMLEVMKTTALLHKVTQPNYEKWPTSSEIINMATKGGARSVMRENEIGSVEIDKKADLLMFDLNSYAFTPLNNVKNHIVYCENGSNIKNVMIAGEMVIQNKEFTRIDEKSVLLELENLKEEFMKDYKKILPYSDELFKYIDNSHWTCIHKPDDLWRFSAGKKEYSHYFKQGG